MVYQVATNGIPSGNPDKISIDKISIDKYRLDNKEEEGKINFEEIFGDDNV